MFSLAIRSLALVSTGILAGTFFGDWMGASPVRPTLSASCFVQFQQGLHLRFMVLMPIVIFTSILTNAAAAWLTRRSNRRAAICFGFSTLAILAVMVMTRIVNIPINEILMTWTAENPPADWWQTWQAWERTHTVRTLLAVLTFAVQIVGMNLSTWRGGDPRA